MPDNLGEPKHILEVIGAWMTDGSVIEFGKYRGWTIKVKSCDLDNGFGHKQRWYEWIIQKRSATASDNETASETMLDPSGMLSISSCVRTALQAINVIEFTESDAYISMLAGIDFEYGTSDE